MLAVTALQNELSIKVASRTTSRTCSGTVSLSQLPGLGYFLTGSPEDLNQWSTAFLTRVACLVYDCSLFQMMMRLAGTDPMEEQNELTLSLEVAEVWKQMSVILVDASNIFVRVVPNQPSSRNFRV